MLKSEIQLANELGPISVIDEGNTTFCIDLHPENALLPIIFTDSGIIISFNYDNPKNAPFLIVSTV